MPPPRLECVTTLENEVSGTCEKGNISYKYAAAGMQGWRYNMEDEHIVNAGDFRGNSLFAVFDGHGGPEVSMKAKEMF